MSQTETTLLDHGKPFQVDSEETVILPASPHAETTVETAQSRIAAMLLGLRYRKFLTLPEQALLDDLAPEGCISFLIAGDKYVHPFNTELFPLEEIQSAMCAPAGSVFSQTKRLANRDSKSFAIMTVALFDMGEDRLIFGMLIPLGLVRDQAAVDHFHKVAHELDEASWATGAARENLNGLVTLKNSWLLVDRSSGRTIAASASASRHLRLSMNDLIGREFGDIRARLQPMIGRGLSMTSLGSVVLPLTLIRIDSAPIASVDSQPTEFLFHHIQNSISCIRSSATQLHDTTCWKPESDESDLALSIASDVTELDRLLHCFQLLHGYGRQEFGTVDLVESVTEFARQAQTDWAKQLSIHTDLPAKVSSVNLPMGAVEHLLKSIIQSHTQDHNSAIEITIRIVSGDDNVIIIVLTPTGIRRHSPTPAKGWNVIADCLATRAGLCLRNEFDENTHNFAAHITIPKSHS